MKLFDVAILGASISGASLGACLGMEAVEVALIDKDRFPRRKACGEGLSNIGIDALKRMGLESAKTLSAGVPYYQYRIDMGAREVPFASTRNRSLKGIGIERYHLDAQLIGQAMAQPSVAGYFESGVTGIDRTDSGYSVHLSSGEEIHSKLLVLADGGHSPGAGYLGIPKVRKDPPMWGISFILEGEYLRQPGEVVVLLKDGFEINCTPVSDSRLNVTFLTLRDRVKSLQDESVRAALLAEACLHTGFTGRPMEAPLQVGPVSPTKRPYFSDSALLLGDAAETLDPVAGMGMTHGILMAEIASQSLLSILKEGKPVEVAFRDYAERAEAMSRPFRGFTRLTASLFRSPARRFLVPTLASTFLPGMIRTALDDGFSSPMAFSLPGQFLSLVGA
jgi:2-polyprenyl-6-methoxyphenol hydroxylase-like FAD-dependent oxidoreductase